MTWSLQEEVAKGCLESVGRRRDSGVLVIFTFYRVSGQYCGAIWVGRKGHMAVYGHTRQGKGTRLSGNPSVQLLFAYSLVLYCRTNRSKSERFTKLKLVDLILPKRREVCLLLFLFEPHPRRTKSSR